MGRKQEKMAQRKAYKEAFKKVKHGHGGSSPEEEGTASSRQIANKSDYTKGQRGRVLLLLFILQ